MTEVKCRVKSCHYWQSGDICNADSITVDNNPVGLSKGNRTRDFEAGDLTAGTPGDISTGQKTRADTEDKNLAKTSHETLCSTFRPKSPETRR